MDQHSQCAEFRVPAGCGGGELSGEMTLDAQRTHIRRFFPALLVVAAGRDTRNFLRDMPEYAGLRSAWMSRRLCRMSEVLRSRGMTMADYSDHLRRLEQTATPDNPMSALDAMIEDHAAMGWKTLSVFVCDCAMGNAFPIDTRVAKELQRHELPNDERLLARLALDTEFDPRRVARMFYVAGGDEKQFAGIREMDRPPDRESEGRSSGAGMIRAPTAR